MTGIDAREAAQALNDIELIVSRVRQSRTYEIASLLAILWGILVFAGNLATWLVPRQAGYIWIGVHVIGVATSFAFSLFHSSKDEARQGFDGRIAIAFLLFYAFGLLSSMVFGHFGPREMGAFWSIYFMLFYCLAGLWFGAAFIAIGLSITALTLIGYAFVTSGAFPIWMALVNGGGLVLAGLLMRRI